jgi:hypothetical protein
MNIEDSFTIAICREIGHLVKADCEDSLIADDHSHRKWAFLEVEFRRFLRVRIWEPVNANLWLEAGRYG